MSKPFQFSMRRMFVGLTLFCTAMAAFVWAWNSQFSDNAQALAAFSAVGATFGGAFGTVVRRPIPFIVVGAVLLPLGVLVFGFIDYFIVNAPEC
jgi:hypothetical protein